MKGRMDKEKDHIWISVQGNTRQRLHWSGVGNGKLRQLGLRGKPAQGGRGVGVKEMTMRSALVQTMQEELV